MIVFKSTNDLSRIPVEVSVILHTLLKNRQGPFIVLLGGELYHLETEMEILEYFMPIYPSCVDKCYQLTESMLFLTSTNEQGGNIYMMNTEMLKHVNMKRDLR